MPGLNFSHIPPLNDAPLASTLSTSLQSTDMIKAEARKYSEGGPNKLIRQAMSISH
jgi:hypothetical protein